MKIPAGADELAQWIVDYIHTVLDAPLESISKTATFDAIGVDSVEAIVMAGVMEEQYGVEIDPMLFFENPTIDAFVAAHAGR